MSLHHSRAHLMSPYFDLAFKRSHGPSRLVSSAGLSDLSSGTLLLVFNSWVNPIPRSSV